MTTATAPRTRLDHLEWLESEAIYILREVAAQCAKPALLFSGGKDSCVVLRLAEKAFRPGPLPFPLLHIDTGHNFPEVLTFRDEHVGALGERLIAEGYPLGPHALAVGLDAGGISLVHAFGGITLATAVVTCLAPMVLLERLTAGRRLVCALLVGLAYMSAAYLTQGAFKETGEALFVLAFALLLHNVERQQRDGERTPALGSAIATSSPAWTRRSAPSAAPSSRRPCDTAVASSASSARSGRKASASSSGTIRSSSASAISKGPIAVRRSSRQ